MSETEEAQVEGSAAQSQGSSPEGSSTQDTQSGAAVDNTEKQQATQPDGSTKEGKRSFFQQRQQDKQQRESDGLKEQVESLGATFVTVDEEAMKSANPAIAAAAWGLYDRGDAKMSPEEMGIARP